MKDSKIVHLASVGPVKVEETPGWRNWRTLGFNGAVVAGAALLTWAAGVDWTQYVSPTGALIIMGGINIGLRLISKGPAMSNVIVKTPS